MISDWYPDIWLFLYNNCKRTVHSVFQSMFYRTMYEPIIIPGKVTLSGMFKARFTYMIYDTSYVTYEKPYSERPSEFYDLDIITSKSFIVDHAPKKYRKRSIEFPIKGSLSVMKCPECGGRGYYYKLCPQCGGTGYVIDLDGRRKTCPRCHGAREIPVECYRCRGEGKLAIWRVKRINYSVRKAEIGSYLNEKMEKIVGNKYMVLFKEKIETEIYGGDDIENFSKATKAACERAVEPLNPVSKALLGSIKKLSLRIENFIDRLSAVRLVKIKMESIQFKPIAYLEFNMYHRGKDRNPSEVSSLIYFNHGYKITYLSDFPRGERKLRISSIISLIIGFLFYCLTIVKFAVNMSIPFIDQLSTIWIYKMLILIGLGFVFSMIIPLIIALIDKPAKIKEIIVLSPDAKYIISSIKIMKNSNKISLLLPKDFDEEVIGDENDPETSVKYLSYIFPLIYKNRIYYIIFLRTLDYRKYLNKSELKKLSRKATTCKIYIIGDKVKTSQIKTVSGKIRLIEDHSKLVDQIIQDIKQDK